MEILDWNSPELVDLVRYDDVLASINGTNGYTDKIELESSFLRRKKEFKNKKKDIEKTHNVLFSFLEKFKAIRRDNNWEKFNFFNISVHYYFLLRPGYDPDWDYCYNKMNRDKFLIEEHRFQLKNEFIDIDILLEYEKTDISNRAYVYDSSDGLMCGMLDLEEEIEDDFDYLENIMQIVKQKTYRNYLLSRLEKLFCKDDLLEIYFGFSEEKFHELMKKYPTEYKRLFKLKELLNEYDAFPKNDVFQKAAFGEDVVYFMVFSAICIHFSSYDKYIAEKLANDFLVK